MTAPIIDKANLKKLAETGWSYKDKKLTKQFDFGTFADAFGFMTVAALGIDKRDHHPTWTNTYNKLSVELSTHDAGDVTAKDVELAQFLDHTYHSSRAGTQHAEKAA